MTKNELNDAYFNWMYQLVFDGRYSKRLSYRKLLRELHRIEFTYSIPMDGNRAEDGVDLRYRFGYENGYSSSMISVYLDNRMCSVLEMMIALAIRCEEHIMDDPDIWKPNWTVVLEYDCQSRIGFYERFQVRQGLC